jgi:hypothetical protein
MKSNILINCLVLFYNVGIFHSDLLTFFTHRFTFLFWSFCNGTVNAILVFELVLCMHNKDFYKLSINYVYQSPFSAQI